MDWLLAVDVWLFRFCNGTMANPVLDWLMPLVSRTTLLPLAVAGLVVFAWKGGPRARVALLLLLAAIAVADGLFANHLKSAVGRIRPGAALPDVRLLIPLGASASMPSAHAANWFAAVVVLGLCYRRSLWLTLPLALLVSVSRVYVGAHYPTDVVVGALIGGVSGASVVLCAEGLWQQFGPRWVPVLHAYLPSLRRPAPPGSLPQPPLAFRLEDGDWRRLAYVLLGILLIARVLYVHSAIIQLSEDEAYQWHWSRHLDLSYYSKPPLIAYTQFLGTALWGHNELGVRFFSPVIAAILGFLLFRFFDRELGLPRTGFWMIVVACATPLLAVGSTLMTIDPLSVVFWTAAMLAGWQAVRRDSTAWWLWTGLWMGLGFLSKYVALFQWLCWAVFFVLWAPARVQLRRPGPWLALAVNALCTLPVLLWNARHQWVTVTHLGERGSFDRAWEPTLRYVAEFVGAEIGLLNPIYFAAAAWAAVAFWRRERRNPLFVYLFSMGTPLFLLYLALSLRSRVLPNWIAPAVVPMFCLAAVYWTPRLRLATRFWWPAFKAATLLGVCGVLILHDTDLVQQLTGHAVPVRIDPKRRVRNWAKTAAVVGRARAELEEKEGKATFILGNHYGLTSLVSFYLPEARAAVTSPQPLVYCSLSDRPKNQFWFWPAYQGYRNRKGDNAIFMLETATPRPPPAMLTNLFSSVEDLGVREIRHEGRPFHHLQLFACRNLR